MPEPKELKKKTFAVNIQNIKQAIGIYVTFTMEFKLTKVDFLAEDNQFFSR